MGPLLAWLYLSKIRLQHPAWNTTLPTLFPSSHFTNPWLHWVPALYWLLCLTVYLPSLSAPGLSPPKPSQTSGQCLQWLLNSSSIPLLPFLSTHTSWKTLALSQFCNCVLCSYAWASEPWQRKWYTLAKIGLLQGSLVAVTNLPHAPQALSRWPILLLHWENQSQKLPWLLIPLFS